MPVGYALSIFECHVGFFDIHVCHQQLHLNEVHLMYLTIHWQIDSNWIYFFSSQMPIIFLYFHLKKSPISIIKGGLPSDKIIVSAMYVTQWQWMSQEIACHWLQTCLITHHLPMMIYLNSVWLLYLFFFFIFISHQYGIQWLN